jgi:hypothetical protein
MSRTIALAPIALLILAAAAPAQTGGDPYNAVAPGNYWGYNDPLTGAANAIAAQGHFLMDFQKARLLNQDVVQKKLETRRKILEHWAWEHRFISDTLEEERQRMREQEIRRFVNDASPAEIYSGAVLNQLRKELLGKFDALGQGQSLSVDPNWLMHVHVASPVGGNTGILKADKIPWPLLVLGRDDLAADRTEIEQLLGKAKTTILQGKTPAAEIIQLRRKLEKLRKRLVTEQRNGPDDSEWSPGQYVAAMRSLKEIKDSLVILERPDAAFYLNPLKGGSVVELMTNMKDQGLTFAPATIGDERYYSSLYYAMRDELKRIEGVPTLDAAKP